MQVQDNDSNTTSITYDWLSRKTAMTDPDMGSWSYAYDDNGNMTARGNFSITWDVENRPVEMSDGSAFIYDGNGNRGKKTEGSETILYINRYYEINLSTEEVTTHYYLGERQIAQRKDTVLNYLHQDHLTGMAMMTDDTGSSTGTIRYFPFGECLKKDSGSGW